MYSASSSMNGKRGCVIALEPNFDPSIKDERLKDVLDMINEELIAAKKIMNIQKVKKENGHDGEER